MKIFIDHYPEENSFAEELALRIKLSNNSLSVITYAQYFEQQISTNSDRNFEGELMDSHDIIIPIITQDYLLRTPKIVYEKIDQVHKDKSKYLLPFIYDNANWSSINWLVRSKTIPSDGSYFTAFDKKNQDKLIKELIDIINEIFQNSIHNPFIQGIKDSKSQKLGKNIFISHDHDDADFAELLKLQLEKEGIFGWIDSERLKIGQDWRTEIDDAIEDSVALIVIMTPEARKSEYVTYEWAFAWGKGVKIFPIMLKQTQLHPRLESLQYLDFTNRVTRPWKELIQSITSLGS